MTHSGVGNPPPFCLQPARVPTPSCAVGRIWNAIINTLNWTSPVWSVHMNVHFETNPRKSSSETSWYFAPLYCLPQCAPLQRWNFSIGRCYSSAYIDATIGRKLNFHNIICLVELRAWVKRVIEQTQKVLKCGNDCLFRVIEMQKLNECDKPSSPLHPALRISQTVPNALLLLATSRMTVLIPCHSIDLTPRFEESANGWLIILMRSQNKCRCLQSREATCSCTW